MLKPKPVAIKEEFTDARGNYCETRRECEEANLRYALEEALQTQLDVDPAYEMTCAEFADAILANPLFFTDLLRSLVATRQLISRS